MPRSNRPRRSGRPERDGGRDGRSGSGRSGSGRGGSGRGGAGRPEARDLEQSLGGLQRVESHPDGDWIVRRVTGAGAARGYVCPGCLQQVAAGTPHVVAWQAEGLMGAQAALEHRRHWHTPCWASRSSRRPR